MAATTSPQTARESFLSGSQCFRICEAGCQTFGTVIIRYFELFVQPSAIRCLQFLKELNKSMLLIVCIQAAGIG